MTITDRLISVAAGQLGVTEHPPGSNRGPEVDRYALDCGAGYLGTPWCAEFQHWIRHQAGLDPGWVSPSTAVLAANARRLGYIGEPCRGGLIVWPGTHVELITAVHPGGVCETIGGNTSDMVARRVRSTAGAVCCAEPAVRDAARAPDPSWEALLVLGLYRFKARRDQALTRLPRGDRAHAAPIRQGNRYGIRLTYGPWADKQAAARALAGLRARFRPHASGLRAVTPKTPSPAPSGLGKTD